MNYQNLVDTDLKMLEVFVDVNPNYREFIDTIKQYIVEDEKDFEKYLKLKESFIKNQEKRREHLFNN